jgi:peptidyl-prolyl cis-trans isomerase C
MTERPSLGTRVWSAVKREPLVLFVVLGGALFWASTRYAPVEVESVRIETAAVRSLAIQREGLLGRTLTAGERKEVTERLIDDEVLLREAIRRELHLSDGAVRERLLEIMRGSLADNVHDPSIARLQAYFSDNVERFTSPESVTLVEE